MNDADKTPPLFTAEEIERAHVTPPRPETFLVLAFDLERQIWREPGSATVFDRFEDARDWAKQLNKRRYSDYAIIRIPGDKT